MTDVIRVLSIFVFCFVSGTRGVVPYYQIKGGKGLFQAAE